MKFELTEKQKKELQRAVDNNPIAKYLRNKDHTNFEVGDVLVKKSLSYQKNWNFETVSSSNKMHQRYVYIFKDEFNIGYVKKLRVSDGKLGDEIYCLADYDFDSTRFEVDPEYAERIFLDAEFDIKEVHRASLEARKLVIKGNRKIGTKPKTLKEFNDFFSKLKAGDTLWVSQDYTCRWLQEYTIVDITKILASKLDQSQDWQWESYRRKEKQNPNAPKFINDDHAYKVKTKDNNPRYAQEREHMAYDFGRDSVFYTVKPGVEDKK